MERDVALRCISSMATKTLLGELARLLGERAGGAIDVESIGGVDAARRVRAGEALDLVVLSHTVMGALENEGHVARGSLVPLARSSTAFAVAAGAARPDLSSRDALQRALLEAPAIAYSTGPSGDHLIGLIERWGLRASLEGKLVKAPPGVPVGGLVADGRASLGFQQYSELFEVPGIDVVTAVAPEATATTVFTGAVASTSAEPDLAAQVLRDMGADALAPVYARCGMSLVRADSPGR
ncbi:substrate-binding domain-containing protein [uncultured Alsobacter sp.]|uniref:substrate-binding domain-containing protein n=1 Tax=uncultured Alsobacter sp. TaxID=1748258 RepID=UPI00345D3457